MSSSPKYQDSINRNNQKALEVMQAFRDDDVSKLLIKWELESDEGYASRQKNSVLFNVVANTINTAKGMLFRRAMSWSDDLNTLFIKEASENMDKNQTSLNEFMKEATINSLWDGISFITVDMPKNEGDEVVSFQQQLERGITPYFVHVRSSQILNRRYQGQKLTQITIDENVTEYDGDFGEKTINQQRVLFIGGGRVYRDDEVIYEWENNLNYIPIVPVYSNKTAFMQGTPKFYPLAKMNLKHYNFMSWNDKSLFCASVPIAKIFGTVNDGENVVIGADIALRFRDKESGDFLWEEFKGTSIDKLQEEIKNVEDRMAKSSLSFLTSNNTEKTATEASIVTTSETSDLSSIAGSIQWSANQCYTIWCAMMNQTPTGEITINRDFVGALTAEEAKVYLEMYNNRTLDLDTLWTELQRREFIQEFDRELVKANIEATNQDLGM